MKYIFAGAIAFCFAFAMPVTSQAAVFAGHLEMVDNGNSTYNLNYRLNEDANVGVTIRIKGPLPATTTVRTFTQGAQLKGAQTVLWDGTDDSSVTVAPGQYAWEIEASTNNPSSDAYVETVNGTATIHTFFSPYGVSTCDITTSTHFGEVYITNGISGTTAASSRLTSNGLYILSNDLDDITSQGDTAYDGGVTWNASASPWRSFVAPDGKVFITDYSDGNSGVWIMDPDNPSGTFSELFDSSSRDSLGLTVNHGSISSVFVEGTGANRVMYSLDEDLPANIPENGSVWAYAIGTTDSGYVTSPTVVYDDAAFADRIINHTGEVIKDPMVGRGGWFISQYRFGEVVTNPNILHFTGTAVDWETSVDFPGEITALARSGAIAVNADGTLLGAAGFGKVTIIDVTDLANESVVFTDNGVGNGHRDINFDAAGNYIITSSNKEQIQYYSKTGPNTFTTPNPAGGLINFGVSSVSGWGLY